MKNKIKKILAVAAMTALVGSTTAFADTYISNSFQDDYGQYMFEVNYASGMRNCYVEAWGSDNYQYKIDLTTYYRDRQEEERSTGYIKGRAKINNRYDDVDDYKATIIVREGLMIRDMVTVYGS
jgi:hypothetical protein